MSNVLVVSPAGAPDTTLWADLAAAQPVWRIDHTADLDAAPRRLPPAVIVVAPADRPSQAASLAAAAAYAPTALRLVCEDDYRSTQQGDPPPSAHQSVPSRLEPLRAVTTAALAVAERLRSAPGLAAQFAQLRDIPSPPAAYFELRERLAAADSTRASLASAAARDPALVARLLKVVNSGFFALPHTVSDLPTAIGLLGGDNLLALVLSTRLFTGLPPPGLNLDALWHHAGAVSTLARDVARSLGANRAACNAAAVAGLLHDLGLLVLLQNEPARYGALWRTAGGDESRLVAFERDTFGFDHGELGALILQLWCLPESIVGAVRGSHRTTAADNTTHSVAARAVQMAEWLAHEGTEGNDATAQEVLQDIDTEVLRAWRAANPRRPNLATLGSYP